MTRGFLGAGRSALLTRLACLACLGGAACLDPLVDDDIDPGLVYGDPAIDPADAPAVDDESFLDRIDYLKGYADGESIWYWNAGTSSNLIAPIYFVLDEGVDPEEAIRTGVGASKPIIDVIPGELGYTPWWRAVVSYKTESFSDERIWSRAAIELGAQQGILTPPMSLTTIVNCPVVHRDTRVEVGDGQTAEPSVGWYRGQRVSLIPFSETTTAALDANALDAKPVYILQRINQTFPLSEIVAGVDLDGDELLNNSNNIFAGNLDNAERYSPLWYVAGVRTPADYPSIDTSTAVGFTAENDLYENGPGSPPAPGVVGDIDLQKENLVNCPIQRAGEKGHL